MDFNDFYYYAMVVKHNGFSAAERATDISKTKLSRKIAQLEKRFGVRLIQRNSRSFSLTEAGYAFYVRCLAVIEEAEIAGLFMMKLQSKPSGTVRISCPYLLAKNHLGLIIPSYMKKNPDVEVVIIETNRQVHLFDERIDLAILGRSNSQVQQGAVTRTLVELRSVLVSSQEYMAGRPQPESPEELNELDTITSMGDKLEGPITWELFGPNKQKKSVIVNPKLRSRDIGLQLHGVVNGLGIGLIPEPYADTYEQKGYLIKIFPGWYTESFSVKVEFLARKGLLPSVRSCLDFIVENLPKTFQAPAVATCIDDIINKSY